MTLRVPKLDDVQKKCADNVCARCRRPIETGHRVTMAMICTNPNAYNPLKITEKGLEFGTDLEFVHIECRDPFLTGRLARELRG